MKSYEEADQMPQSETPELTDATTQTTTNKKVLIIAYLFPPIGGGGVQRALKMAKYLGHFGWEVHVLTVEPSAHVSLDESLLQQLPPSVKIHRSKEFAPWRRPAAKAVRPAAAESTVTAKTPTVPRTGSVGANSHTAPRGFVSRIKRTLFPVVKRIKQAVFVPDEHIVWGHFAARKGHEVMDKHQIDVIFSTSGPNSNHLVGLYIKRKTGKPWIADFRDPWTQNMHRPHAQWREWFEDRLERMVHREADCTLTVTQSFADNFKDKFSDEIGSIEVIHNGFDREDYIELEEVSNRELGRAGAGKSGKQGKTGDSGVLGTSDTPGNAGTPGTRGNAGTPGTRGNAGTPGTSGDHVHPSISHADHKCTFIYTGIFYKERNPRLFLKAVKSLVDEKVLPRERIHLQFAGVFDYPGYTENVDCVRELGLEDIVEVMGHLPHKRVLQAMKSADVLMLVGDTHPDSGNYIPGKLYEYMAVGHPILALSLPGESTRIIEQYQLGKIADPKSLEQIKAALLQLFQSWDEQRKAEAVQDKAEAEQRKTETEQPNAEEAAMEKDSLGEDGKADFDREEGDINSASLYAEAAPPRPSALIYERKEQARMLADLMRDLTKYDHYL
jgi:glycosyltransferase involved in cell wall biosynthesis